MARLVITSAGFEGRAIELNLGVNRFGRSPKNDVQIDHPTVSEVHCEVVLTDKGVVVRDCASTNGTFVGGERTSGAILLAGQTLHLGEVELRVETTEVNISIPQFDMPRPAPPVVLADGSLICPRHPNARATHQCTNCRQILCNECVHWLRRRGGKVMKFCPLCSHACEPLGVEKRKRRSIFGFWRRTVKLPSIQGSKRPQPKLPAEPGSGEDTGDKP
jgi:hypothetical protein